MAWDGIVKKFEQLAEPYTSPQLRREIVGAVWEIEAIPVTDVLALLAKIHAA